MRSALRKMLTDAKHSTTVGVFDSGAGGLSILQELMSRKLNVDYVYLADRAMFPYGRKSVEELSAAVERCIGELIKHYSPSIIIIACNTASTYVLPRLRERWPEISFVGVVPAIKPAAAMSKSGHIAVLATPATVTRPYLDDLIKRFAPNLKITKIGSSALVSLVEHFLLEKSVNMDHIATEIAELRANTNDADLLVLACTHFPIIKLQLKQCLGTKNIQIIDSGKAIANRCEDLLLNLKIARPSPRELTSNCTVISTSECELRHYASWLIANDLDKTNFTYRINF